jgi:hypothetical protein
VLCGIGVTAVSGQWFARYDTPGIGVLGGWDGMCKDRLPLVDFSFFFLFFTTTRFMTLSTADDDDDYFTTYDKNYVYMMDESNITHSRSFQ